MPPKRAYLCTECGYSCSRADTLNSHMLTCGKSKELFSSKKTKRGLKRKLVSSENGTDIESSITSSTSQASAPSTHRLGRIVTGTMEHHRIRTVDIIDEWKDIPNYISPVRDIDQYLKSAINWLRYSWATRTNIIFEGEKEIEPRLSQIISFLYSLYKEDHSRGPFLVVVPKETFGEWMIQLRIWAPDMLCLPYANEKDWEYIKWILRKRTPRSMFQLIVTMDSLVNADPDLLMSLKWKVLAIDQGEESSLMFSALKHYQIDHKMLFINTLERDSLEEMFDYLNFMCPGKFSNLSNFLNEFSTISKEEQLEKLHHQLGPQLLRRLQEDAHTPAE